MSTLACRRAVNPLQETWHIYFGDVRVGVIGERAGIPIHADQGARSVGFYPGMEPKAHRRGIAGSFAAAREAFEATWAELLPTIPDGAFAEWRHDRDSRARGGARSFKSRSAAETRFEVVARRQAAQYQRPLARPVHLRVGVRSLSLQ
ncbi:hypothetical protein LUI11_37525 [Bradyrhizobium diazoefficiens]|uniref:Uncharacterized protein n=1 Tax=Bradyrhizobium diazoefficiens SEMIA 5080 TaxID=754504 RepID=A0A837CQ19_9BRAD|nr:MULTISPECIES: hypothetical protein [Bradyrhizobium]APO52187.1 hypothetical protein BD122_17965 [Bradyrhizobium diazoefficiens]KGJ71252.1 hypothetical protein BJA5080_08404 [Bradyrhizobium diazoefficiens SEMIA 5080]MCD9298236.1 hypothetical protein [Bradyrhizobium diazoefficiens]MCD9815618.1 hypothetical protein [Bradyrhizobium diazoefficiens]MCD9833547.1 hypothetical protein [Bradyrhizobium diazoefficiens]